MSATVLDVVSSRMPATSYLQLLPPQQLRPQLHIQLQPAILGWLSADLRFSLSPWRPTMSSNVE